MTTMKKLVLGVVVSLSVAACGGKAASGPTTPSNNSGAMSAPGGSEGSAAEPAAPAGSGSAEMPSGGAGGDPCGG